MSNSEKLTLIEWYVEREKETLQLHPELRIPLSNLLKNDPTRMLNSILENLGSDVIKANFSGKLANTIVSIYDSNFHAQEVLEAFKKEFIII